MAADMVETVAGKRFSSHKTVVMNFILMSVCFGANHGCVTALIAISSSALPEGLSGQSVGALYVCYTLSSMLFANTCVAKWGPKWTIFVGCSVYCAYVASFLIAIYTTGTVTKIACIGGGVIGGLGAGLLWTAQGKFFAASTDIYAAKTGVSKESATATFATIFTFIFLGFEFGLKILTSLVSADAHVTLYIIFTVVSVASSLGLLFVKEVTYNLGGQMGSFSMFEKSSAALALYFQDIKVLLLLPYSFTFGLAAPFLNQYVNAKITTDLLGPCKAASTGNSTTPGPMYSNMGMGMDTAAGYTSSNMFFGPLGNTTCPNGHTNQYVGFMSAVVVATGVVTSVVFGYLNKQNIVPKAVPMVFASLCFTTIAVMFVANSEEWFAHWGRLVPLYVLFGIGRGVFESTSKAVFADFFQGPRATAGFANSAMQNGLSGSIGFFIFPMIDYHYKAYIVVFFGGLGIITYTMADRINTKSKKHDLQQAINQSNDGPTKEDRPLLDEA